MAGTILDLVDTKVNISESLFSLGFSRELTF